VEIAPHVGLRQCIEHLSRSQGVPYEGDIVNFGNILHNIDLRHDVIRSHLIPREVPEMALLPTIWLILLVPSAVCGAARVAKPDIVTFVSQYKCGCLIGMRDNPAIG